MLARLQRASNSKLSCVNSGARSGVAADPMAEGGSSSAPGAAGGAPPAAKRARLEALMGGGEADAGFGAPTLPQGASVRAAMLLTQKRRRAL